MTLESFPANPSSQGAAESATPSPAPGWGQTPGGTPVQGAGPESAQPLAAPLSQTFRAAFALFSGACPNEAQRRRGVGIANLLLDWGADEAVIVAGLLHELVYNGLVNVHDVAAICNEDAAALCANYRDRFAAVPPQGWRGCDEALRRVRVYAAAYADPRLALLCVAHMAHSVLFDAGAAHKSSLALSHDEIHSVLLPILDMMGMRELRDQVYLYTRHSRAGSRSAEATPGRARDGQPLTLQAELLRSLLALIGAELPNARLTLRDLPFALGERSQPGDRIAEKTKGETANLQVIVPAPADCYLALHALHRLYRPVDGALVDTISASRRNGHRSLQSAVVAGETGRWLRLNLEIVTPEMDEVNRWGVAAFVLGGRPEPRPVATGPWRSVWWRGAAAKDALLRSAAQGSLAADTVAVFSPLGEIFTFERGCTVVDYAYHVHSDLAEQCQRFYVNFESVEPATVLRHMDLVELEINPRAPGPSLLWLNAALTKRARTRIRRQLRRQTQGITEGQRILETRLHDLATYYGFQIADHRVEEAIARGARTLGLKSPDDLLAEMAAGRVAVDRYVHPLFAEEIARRVDLPRSMRLRPHQILLAQCCKPRPGDDVAGLPYQRSGVLTKLTVHRVSCPRFLGLSEAARAEAVSLRWKLRSTSKIMIQLEMTARDEDGLLGEALHQIYAVLPRVTLLKTDATARRGMARIRFSLEADSPETVDEVADALRRLPNREVMAVRQLALPPSEQEALHADAAGAANPYSRMPVHDNSMFFGRAAELERISEWLHNSVSCIWLRGQKRVGKTSLMLHLRRDYWEPHDAVCAYVDFQRLNNPAQANIFYEVALAIYTDLQRDPRITALGAPDRAHFESMPSLRLQGYLRDVQQRLGTRRLVILIDEFSRITDLYLGGQISGDFFWQWRSLLQGTERFCSFITVVQQKTFEHMRHHVVTHPDDPCWHVLELGDTLYLKPFSLEDARRLVQWPMRNFMEYAPGSVEQVIVLTGGSPFLIQAFCNKLVTQLSREGSRTVEPQDVRIVAEEFMQPSESIFAHLLDQALGFADHICTQAALLCEEAADVTDAPVFTWEGLCATLPEVAPDKVRATLGRLTDADILASPAEGQWRFNSRLFQRWLALHS